MGLFTKRPKLWENCLRKGKCRSHDIQHGGAALPDLHLCFVSVWIWVLLVVKRESSKEHGYEQHPASPCVCLHTVVPSQPMTAVNQLWRHVHRRAAPLARYQRSSLPHLRALRLLIYVIPGCQTRWASSRLIRICRTIAPQEKILMYPEKLIGAWCSRTRNAELQQDFTWPLMVDI